MSNDVECWVEIQASDTPRKTGSATHDDKGISCIKGAYDQIYTYLIY
jgi:hypothetical protein